jgi:hypothetical protein
MLRTVLLTSNVCLAAVLAAGPVASAQSPVAKEAQFVQQYCVDCHDAQEKSGGIRLDDLGDRPLAERPGTWEKVIRKLELRQMPPPDAKQPDHSARRTVIDALTKQLDSHAAANPRPGRTETFRRLTRFEYQNAVRDLVGVRIDAAALLPPDESSQGFDNITVTGLSPTLVKRYIAAAEHVARLATGAVGKPVAFTHRIRPDVTQDVHLEGLPLGTRGGALIPYTFPRAGEYEVQIRLMRDRNDNVEGLKESHDLEVLLDRERKASFQVSPPKKGDSDERVDAHLVARIQAPAGAHDLGVTFLSKGAPLLETVRQPLNVHFNFYRHPRLGPAIYEVSIVGPLDPSNVAGIGLAQPPEREEDEWPTAERTIASVLRRALRRPLAKEDLETPLRFFEQGRAEGGYQAGIRSALEAILVHPQFLFRLERDPEGLKPGTPYKLNDLELATRLSFFLWSSLPDDELLELAERGELSRPIELRRQTARMLADQRSSSLVTNFADQWLYLRNLETVTPDMRLYPDFDDNLRQALRRETELLFESVQREDHSVLDLLRSRDTFLNERLAKHYGIPGVFGSHFRRVSVDGTEHRGGLLRQGSVLTVTSYATRTSPVIRGKWVLENLLASPPPPPPENVPALSDNTVNASLSVRARLAQHREHEACAVCHDRIDPIGLALENFDAVGRWRDLEEGRPVDASGGLFPGQTAQGIDAVEQTLIDHPELFARALTEKLLTYALGRGMTEQDAPAIRQIVRQSAADNFRFSSLIQGIVESVPFQMRSTAP